MESDEEEEREKKMRNMDGMRERMHEVCGCAI
jgi:hypothetical protein